MDVSIASRIAADAMRVQGTRLRVISENIANASSTGNTQESLPYRRQVVTFEDEFNRELGARTIQIADVNQDDSEFQRRFLPGHPAADDEGFVLFPNVNTLVEMMDMREAQRSYEANLNVVDTARSMLSRTVELLRT